MDSLESKGLTITDLKDAKQRDPSALYASGKLTELQGYVFTSKSSQQDLLVEGHGPLVLTRYLVSHSFINGKAGH